MDNNPIIDLEWRALARQAQTTIPDDPDLNRCLVDDYTEFGHMPHGCSITNGNNLDRLWVAKIYVGGKQRVLGYGSCYQCARLYDVALLRFSPYRTAKPVFCKNPYNFDVRQATEDNEHKAIGGLMNDMEKLLKSRDLLMTAEQRAALAKTRRADYQHDRYTATGRMEKLIEQLFGMIEAQSAAIERLQKEVAKNTLKALDWRTTVAPGYTAPILTCKAEGSV